MIKTKTVEVTVGLFVILGFAALFYLAMQVSNLSAFGVSRMDGYSVTAHFENVGSLKVGAPVTIAGVRVGRVTAIGIDHKTQEAAVQLTLSSEHNDIPLDTTASILTSGLLGEQYVGLEPGGDEKVLKEGDEIKLTQSALVLEKIISQVLFSKAAEGPGESPAKK